LAGFLLFGVFGILYNVIFLYGAPFLISFIMILFCWRRNKDFRLGLMVGFVILMFLFLLSAIIKRGCVSPHSDNIHMRQ
jgi:CHASE2 domain-containing sensor protein